MRHLDITLMFVSLWLLASMVIDAVTPKDLSIYMIGAAIAPATAVSAALYWLRVPTIDFGVVFATTWMVSEMILELITPQPLSPVMAAVAIAPLALVGIVVNYQGWRSAKTFPRTVDSAAHPGDAPAQEAPAVPARSEQSL